MPFSRKTIARAAFAIFAITLIAMPAAAQEKPAQAQESVKDPVERFVNAVGAALDTLKTLKMADGCGIRIDEDASALFLYGSCIAKDGSFAEELLDEIVKATLTAENAEMRATETAMQIGMFSAVADARAQNGELAVRSEFTEKEKAALVRLVKAIGAVQLPDTLREKTIQHKAGYQSTVFELQEQKTLVMYTYTLGEKGVRRYALTSKLAVADLVAATPEQLSEFVKRIFSDAEAYLDTLSK